MRNQILLFIFILDLLFLGLAYFWMPILYAFVVLGPLSLMAIYDSVQSKHSIMRNFPIIGRGRYWLEGMGPKIYQYFVESDLDGRPFHRNYRTIVYQRAKNELKTHPFGTQQDVYAEGYEWMKHSLYPLDAHQLDQDPKVTIGGPDCTKPYNSSILNISAMSFGALSKNAIEALNGGAKMGGFAHNTGEGGVSPYHLKPGGDLVWQVGTGYFGCRAKDGNFSPELFIQNAAPEQIKMIEIKLSQGAKPGHGGILPGSKNTPEIAKIRTVEPYQDAISPPYHKAFSNSMEMLDFIAKVREMCGGRPVGIKLCIGLKAEFLALCHAMVKTGLKPDFITIDGGEGGTGAAPLEFSNSVGMPFRDGLAFAVDALRGFDLKKDITLVASGKILTGFHIFRAMAIGADVCNSARAMMLAVGCIQALECNKNTCPTGVATQRPDLVKGLVIPDKAKRVANYHKETVTAFVELLAATGLSSVDQVERYHINRRVLMNNIQRYDQIFPPVEVGSFLQPSQASPYYQGLLREATKLQ